MARMVNPIPLTTTRNGLSAPDAACRKIHSAGGPVKPLERTH